MIGAGLFIVMTVGTRSCGHLPAMVVCKSIPSWVTVEAIMPEFVIEREMPGAGSLSRDDLKMASQTSCSVLRDLGPQIQWVHSYVTDNKIYCVYRAPNEEMIREHAQRGGFPANKISQVRATIDPTTAE
jgi:hypothetical protein